MTRTNRTRATRRPPFPALVALALASILGTSGCALTSKAELVEIRHFSPERVRPRSTSKDSAALTPPTTAAGPNGPFDLRLGRITSGGHLRERIAYRDAAYELGYYEELRWTERPETFVRRAIGRALFEEHGMHRVVRGDAPTLELEVIAFDDVRLPAARAARVQLKVVLLDDRGVLYEETVTVERPVAAETAKIEDVVAAMAEALDAAADQVTMKVQAALATRRERSLADRESTGGQVAPDRP